MAYFIGIVVAIFTVLLVSVTRLDRDRAAYPLVLIVVAHYYVLFAVMGGSPRALGIELVVMLGFTLVAVVGFARNLWWVAAGLMVHGAFDLVHGRLVTNPGVPAYWPAFCLAADVCLAAGLAGLMLRRRLRATMGLQAEGVPNPTEPGAEIR